MAIDAVKIPSNIQVEEQIIGPLSLRQIIIMLITGGFSYVIWVSLSGAIPNMNIILHALSWSPLMIGTAFSFVHVNGVSLLTLVLLAVEGIEKPRIRTFGPRSGIGININTQSIKEYNAQPVEQIAPATDLATLSSILDTAPRQEDQQEKQEVSMQADEAIEYETDDGLQDIHIDLNQPTEITKEFEPMRDITPPLQ